MTLADGTRLSADAVIDAAGTRGAHVARMAGVEMPVEPRKRYTWVFEAARPLDRDLPLTIDPSGVHCRQDGAWYMAGATPPHDPAVDPDDFARRTGRSGRIWSGPHWPHAIPAFEEIRVQRAWVGALRPEHLRRERASGPHRPGRLSLDERLLRPRPPAIGPAMGRGLAERLIHGGYRSIDLTPFSPERVLRGERFPELAVI